MPAINFRRQRRLFIEGQRRDELRAAREHRALMLTDHYSEQMVLRSAAGWYIGTMFWDAEYMFWCPGSRDSGYFASELDAQRVFNRIVEG